MTEDPNRADLRGRPFAAWLEVQLDARSVRVHSAERMSGGAIQQNWAIDLEVVGGERAGHHALVFRADAPSSILASSSRASEYAWLEVMHAAGVKVPEPFLLCDDPVVVGRSFYLMRRMDGVAAGHRLVKDDTLDGDALVVELGAELARVHGVRRSARKLGFLAAPASTPAQQRVGTYRAYLDAIAGPQPVLEWALRWLEHRAPDGQTLALCHGDYRTGNLLVHQGALSAVLDWEFAGLSDPNEDIGWFCAPCWRFGRREREAGGLGAREAFYRGYEQVSGKPVDRAKIPYWEVMATVRWAVIALQQGQRYLSGSERSLELALTSRMVSEMEYDALNAIERLERWGAGC